VDRRRTGNREQTSQPSDVSNPTLRDMRTGSASDHAAPLPAISLLSTGQRSRATNRGAAACCMARRYAPLISWTRDARVLIAAVIQSIGAASAAVLSNATTACS
jgi:hypothetical protein